ncbi:NAC domain-containing protein 58-like [Syzygium oleosum]|uniref:NAC domain-containing protein 58-like n=1 Tax=Syzygium oleosum TaxID=219896 RepID=UPI0024BB5481|nr:NAC domain-containing protein 58-like [Syzygium oleosum]
MAIRHPGFYFQPTDEHLFFHYLLQRLNQEPLPDPNVVRDCNVYGGDPWKIFGKDRDKKFYVFTVLKKKNKSRVDRTAGSGTWKGERSDDIRDSQGKLVGYKKLFSFKSKARLSAKADKAENGHWIMCEYSTHPHNETECVLCVIRNKYAEKVNKNGCRNLHGRVQLEEENRRAKKAARPLRYDHANAIDDPSTALPLSTPAAAQARPAASPAINEDAVPDPPPTVTPIVTWTVPQYICCDANYVNSLPTTTTTVQQDTCGFGSLAFGGTACLNPTTTAAVAVQDDIFYAADSQAFAATETPILFLQRQRTCKEIPATRLAGLSAAQLPICFLRPARPHKGLTVNGRISQ